MCNIFEKEIKPGVFKLQYCDGTVRYRIPHKILDEKNQIILDARRVGHNNKLLNFINDKLGVPFNG